MSDLIKATPPNLIGFPVVEFNKNSFDALIFNKGYDIIIEKAVRCPCEGIDGVSKSDCQNCYGTGYFYVNPFKTIAIVSGINRNTQFKEWSEELIGTVSLTLRDDNDDREKVAFYDRISLVKKRNDQLPIYGVYSEILRIRDNGEGGKFVFLTYKVQEIIDIFYYVDSKSPLIRLDSSEYKVNSNNPYVIDFLMTDFPINLVISIRYKHDLQYHVIDIPHEVRYSTRKNKDGRTDVISLPINAIARRSHILQVSRPDYDGSGIQDNSYL